MDKKIIIATILFAVFSLAGNAQDTYFEGEITYEGLVNVDAGMLNYMMYNGKENHKSIMKGKNFHGYDMRINMHVIVSEDLDLYMVYSDELKKGVSMSLTKYRTEQRKLENRFGIQTPKTILTPTSDLESMINGIKCKTYKSHREETGRRTECDYWLWDKYKYYDAFETGVQYVGIPIRQRTDFIDSGIKVHHYQMSRATEVKEREVSLDEFKAPSGYAIKTVNGLLAFGRSIPSLYKENANILKRKGLYPTSLDDNVVYDIDGNWDD